MDDKARNIISYGLDINEYNRVSACETVQEMWRLLEVTHEGTNQVKETKINMLVQQYEPFKMKENEFVNEMYSSVNEVDGNDEVAQLCFMAKDDYSSEVISNLIPSINNFDYNKLEIAFLESSEKYEKSKSKNTALQKNAFSLINTVEELASKKEYLDVKVEFYAKESYLLKASLTENSNLSSGNLVSQMCKNPF
ncbi:hypothetical protein RJ640_005869 [Escallonia rubra]|uniref:Uncharacterized protein n=1 Tax=Escallonia rubra TaxID=112253 RepID=A0AA88RR07_9ASTE|nr:hypothetical protein RJ640_005869 [Escallonia rubra]